MQLGGYACPQGLIYLCPGIPDLPGADTSAHGPSTGQTLEKYKTSKSGPGFFCRFPAHGGPRKPRERIRFEN